MLAQQAYTSRKECYDGRLAKAFVGPILQRSHAEYERQIMSRTFVDDAIVRVEGTEKNVGDILVKAGGSLCADMVEADLKVNPKTVVVASSVALALRAVNGLRERWSSHYISSWSEPRC